MTGWMAMALVFVMGMAGLSGCATSPRRAEVAPVVVAPVVDNSAEIERLKQQIRDQEAALSQAEADKRALQEKLDSAAAKKVAQQKTEDTYLK